MNFINPYSYQTLKLLKPENVPFDHIIIDNLFDDYKLTQVLNEYPDVSDKKWWVYNNQLERKYAFNKLEELSQVYTDFFAEVNSEEFVSTLSKIFDLPKLSIDKDLLGGGLHQIMRGGKLDVHEDFNIHRGLGAFRRLNMIVYLNKNWNDEYGGHLELWSNDMQKLHKRVLPVFNRTVFFRTDMTSNHGHPNPLTCPENMSRKSLAVYYYEKTPLVETTEYRSTVYKKRPTDPDDPKLDELREKRKLGRIEDKTT